MTHDILRTDIELATRLLAEKRPDNEIVAALVPRGLEPATAAQLVDDLRNGRKVNVQSALPMELGLARRSRSRSGSHGTRQDQPSRSSQAESRREPPRHATAHGSKKSKIPWRIPAILVALVVVVVGILVFLRYRAETGSTEEVTTNAPMPKANGASTHAPATAAAPSNKPSTASLALELQPDGLHLGGSVVTPGNVLATVAQSLGVATRTNRVGQTDTVIYAYDQQGLLIYSQPGGGTNSIILDCEANGGTHGTLSPFAGTLTVEGQVIHTDTDSQTLTAIKQLGLSRPGSNSGVWGGSYNGLNLVFAYLKSPQRLSLIEIDLK
jgi:hypothetical protein